MRLGETTHESRGQPEIMIIVQDLENGQFLNCQGQHSLSSAATKAQQ